MKELLAKLALLNSRIDVSNEAMKAEEDKAEKKLKMDELSAMLDERDELNAEIKEAEEAEALQARLTAADQPNQSKTKVAGELGASTIKTYDNVYNDPCLGFKNYGDFAKTVASAAMGVYDDRLNIVKSGDNIDLRNAGLRQSDGPAGGFLVPIGVRSAELENEVGMSLDLFSMTRGFELDQEESVQIPAINETSRKDGSLYGGITAKWLEEEGVMEESEPEFRLIDLKPKEIAIFVKVTDKLLRNSPTALGQFLDFASRDVLTFKLSDAVLNGDGNGKPKGILKSGALVTVAKQGSQVAKTVVIQNTTKMVSRLSRKWKPGAVWLVNKDVIPELEVLTIGDRPVFIPGGSVAGQTLDRLHGFPIIETEYSEELGDKGDIVLCNLAAYLRAQHGGGVRSDTSIHVNFDQNKTAFRFITDADGQTWLNKAITNFKGTGTTSPFVTLAERA